MEDTVVELIVYKIGHDLWLPIKEDPSLKSKFCSGSEGDLSCTIDLAGDFPEDFALWRKACSYAGGQQLMNDYTETCQGITLEWKNEVDCLPLSCRRRQ